ncbi:hypothetical protein [Actinoplanes sp. NPDC051411]|uniref:hypothetical protein n=1 Tax=Actinoplanes sp. NPDC051411 TaxID=3155522 RepID=UPI0034209840
MRLFRRGPRSRFPADMTAWLETFGRHRLDSSSIRVDSDTLWRPLPVFLEDAKADPDGFLTDLAEFVAGDRSGFVTLGAAGLVWELFSGDALRIPAALPLIDAGIAMKRERNLPGLAFTGYEWERIHAQRG